VAKANRKKRCWRLIAGVCVLAAVQVLKIDDGSAQQLAVQSDQQRLKQNSSTQKPLARANVTAAVAASNVTSSEADAQPVRKPKSGAQALGPYYVDFRARTAASYGHAFVWFGKTSEKRVEVAGLHPKGEEVAYVLGHLMWVPAETGASYGDLDVQYLTASYRVYLSETDGKKVFAYIKHLQATSTVWNAQTANCTAFIGRIATFMGLKVPSHLQRPEGYVNELKQMNGGRRTAQLAPDR
jgi:cell wall-associated NlpC family hydrolase